MAKKVTTEMIKERLYNVVKDEYTLVSEYQRGSVKVELLHKVCGEVCKITPNHFFYDNTRCKCTMNSKDRETFAKEFNEVSKGNYTQMDNYKRTNIKIRIRHNVCDSIFSATPKSFLSGKGCPDCFGNKTKTTEEFRREVDEKSKGKFLLISEYINNRVKVEIKHVECGKTYKVTPKDFIRGNRCPYCKQSKGEIFIQGILDEKGVTYEIQKSFDALKVNHQKLPFDFFLPEQNILIEYDGVQHFEEVKYFGGAKKLSAQQRRDALKDEYANKNSINLVRIPYTYTEEKIKEVIVSYL